MLNPVLNVKVRQASVVYPSNDVMWTNDKARKFKHATVKRNVGAEHWLSFYSNLRSWFNTKFVKAVNLCLNTGICIGIANNRKHAFCLVQKE